MFKRINLDHCYNEDKNFKLFKLLGKSGFILEPQMVEHPGKAFCKFIALQSGNSRKNFYLEFVHIGKGGIEEKTPGLSFAIYPTLDSRFSFKVGDVSTFTSIGLKAISKEEKKLGIKEGTIIERMNLIYQGILNH